MFVLWAAPQPQDGILSVEPDPTSLRCLKLNIERDDLGDVTAMQAAAGSYGGMMELICRPGLEMITYNAKVSAPWFYKKTAPARLLRSIIAGIDQSTDLRGARAAHHRAADVARTHHGRSGILVVNDLKLDLRGSEIEVLRNTSGACWSRIERAAIEYDEFGRDRRVAELVTILKTKRLRG